MKKNIAYLLLLLSTTATANEADVIDVKIKCYNDCTFFVTVKPGQRLGSLCKPVASADA